jgi:carboxymethylenebutenolidase
MDMDKDQEALDLYGQYTRGNLNRREFLGKLTALAGGTAAACALLPLLEKSQAHAAKVPPDDARLEAAYVDVPGATGGVRAYWVHPKGADKRAGIVVVHENKGLNPHIEDVARRLALEGFVAAAPDALSPVGGTPEDAKAAVEMIRKLDPQKTLEDFIAAVRYLDSHPSCTGKLGVVGFCWGGAMANRLAVHAPEVDAAVPYYGGQPAAEEVPKIKASLLLHYAGLDERINKGIPAFETALKGAGADYRIHMYAGAKHAFNNDTNPERYHKASADLAWQRTVAFFKEKLNAG